MFDHVPPKAMRLISNDFLHTIEATKYGPPQKSSLVGFLSDIFRYVRAGTFQFSSTFAAPPSVD